MNGDSINLWSLKVIFRGFELSMELRVNFPKSNIYGVNLSEWSMLYASSFLWFSIDGFPYKFLGIMNGDSPKKASMWKYLVKNLHNKMSTWKSKHILIGGRVVMINAVLNPFPVYLLFFYKASVQILN